MNGSKPQSDYLCGCGYDASAQETPFGWMIECWDSEECGSHTGNSHRSLELAEQAWEKMGGKKRKDFQ